VKIMRYERQREVSVEECLEACRLCCCVLLSCAQSDVATILQRRRDKNHNARSLSILLRHCKYISHICSCITNAEKFLRV